MLLWWKINILIFIFITWSSKLVVWVQGQKAGLWRYGNFLVVLHWGRLLEEAVTMHGLEASAVEILLWPHRHARRGVLNTIQLTNCQCGSTKVMLSG